MDAIKAFLSTYFDWLYIPKIGVNDVLDILIIAYMAYHVLKWIQRSRAQTLMRGIIVVAIFLVIANLLKLNTVVWLAKTVANVIVIAFIILFQPELRHALDELGRSNFFRRIKKSFGEEEEVKLSDQTIEALSKAAITLGKAKTGALIVVEHATPLGEWEHTGIQLDAIVTEQLLINIFEKNTPLHDGAIIVRNNRITSATCYLPLSEDMSINKELGTRHRAALGISEVTDSMTLIVSEETGAVSIAYKGMLYRNLRETEIRNHLFEIQDKDIESKEKHLLFKKGGKKNAE